MLSVFFSVDSEGDFVIAIAISCLLSLKHLLYDSLTVHCPSHLPRPT
jgi:hypothetical protein